MLQYSMVTIYFYDTKVGKIGIGEKNEKVIAVVFDGERYDPSWTEKDTPLKKKTIKQINEYLDGKRKTFDIDIYYTSASSFFSRIMKILKEIPYGKTITYKDIARKVNNPKAYRAVGMVCNRNPLPILIPCHRVIATTGAMIGYKGGVEIKKKLIDLEKGIQLE